MKTSFIMWGDLGHCVGDYPTSMPPHLVGPHTAPRTWAWGWPLGAPAVPGGDTATYYMSKKKTLPLGKWALL